MGTHSIYGSLARFLIYSNILRVRLQASTRYGGHQLLHSLKYSQVHSHSPSRRSGHPLIYERPKTIVYVARPLCLRRATHITAQHYGRTTTRYHSMESCQWKAVLPCWLCANHDAQTHHGATGSELSLALSLHEEKALSSQRYRGTLATSLIIPSSRPWLDGPYQAQPGSKLAWAGARVWATCTGTTQQQAIAVASPSQYPTCLPLHGTWGEVAIQLH